MAALPNYHNYWRKAWRALSLFLPLYLPTTITTLSLVMLKKRRKNWSGNKPKEELEVVSKHRGCSDKRWPRREGWSEVHTDTQQRLVQTPFKGCASMTVCWVFFFLQNISNISEISKYIFKVFLMNDVKHRSPKPCKISPHQTPLEEGSKHFSINLHSDVVCCQEWLFYSPLFV